MNSARRSFLKQNVRLGLGLGASVLGSPAAFADPGWEPLAQEEDDKPEWVFSDPAEMPVEGRGWDDVARPFARLPARAKELVRDRVWNLAQDSAGLFVSFTTDAAELRFEVELLRPKLAMAHMPATGVSGLDLYAREAGGPWRWVFATQPRNKTYSATLGGLRPETREYRLYLPLYNGVEALRIGTREGVELQPTRAPKRTPLVYYGTSIAQGACASRAGMAFVSQLGRRLDVPVINLGFSGNGKLEPEIADLMGELDARAYVLDCLPNLGPKAVAERTIPVVQRLRAKRPATPIVMVEDRTNPNAVFLPARAAHHRGNHGAFRACYEELLAQGTSRLTYVEDAPFLGEDGEGTVDGSHPTDLGMSRYADALEPVLRGVLRDSR